MIHGPDYQFIKEVAVFRDMGEESLERLFTCLKKTSFSRGETIFEQESRVDRLYILEMGRVEIFKSDILGKKLTLWHVEPGELFCLANIFAEKAFAGARAETDCLAYYLELDDLNAILAADSGFSPKLMGCMSRKVVAYSSLIEDMTFKNIQERLASLILRCATLSCSRNMTCTLNQKEMASLLGTSREVVSRTLKKLRESGAIEMIRAGKAKHIRVRDLGRLRKMGAVEDQD